MDARGPLRLYRLRKGGLTMKAIFTAAALVAVAGLLGGCHNPKTGGSGSGVTNEAASTSAAMPTQAAADAIPANCQIDPSVRASLVALPANAAPSADEADYQALSADDDTLPDGSRYDVMRINARAGQRVQVRISGQGFLPRLLFYSPDRCPLSMTDASSGGALLDERLDTTGNYWVLITSTQPGQTGAYSGGVDISTETPL